MRDCVLISSAMVSGCAGGGHVAPLVPAARARAAGAVTFPAPFDERSMHALAGSLPITAAQLRGVPHLSPSVTLSRASSRAPENSASDDDGGQSGYIVTPGSGAGDGSIYVAMTAYDDAWVTTPTNGSYNTVNAPTTHGPNGNCIETVTNYYNGFGTPGTTVDQVQFYDFCANGGQGGFVGALPMNAQFVRDYVRTYADPVDPLPRYISSVVHSAVDDRWHAYLYDATLGQYVDYYDSAVGANSQVQGGEGWSIFETHYYSGACSTLPDVSAEALQIRTPAGWQPLNADEAYSYAEGACFTPPLSVPYYAPAFAAAPTVAWTVTSHAAPAVSEYARSVRADAPLAYYRLGDSGIVAVDSSGSGSPHNGTYGASVTRGAPSLLAVEASNAAAGFPGGKSTAANIVRVAPAATLEPTAAVSIEGWVDVTHANAGGTTDLISYGAASLGQPYTLQLLPGATLALSIVTTNGRASVAGATVLAPGKPYFVAGTYDGSRLCVYVDGVLDGSAPVTGALDYAQVSNGLAIGSAFASPRQAFTGSLDEVAVYGSALTAGQIASHWTAGAGVAPPAASAYAAAVMSAAPLAYYRLDDATPVALDAGANHLNAHYGAAVEREMPSLIGADPTNNAAVFPGGTSTPNVAVSTARSPALEPSAAVSIETWVDTPARSPATADLVSYGPMKLGQPYTLQLLANGTAAMSVSTAAGLGYVSGQTPLSLGTPHLIAATYDGTTMSLYVDGSLDAAATHAGALSYADESPAYGLSIGTAFASTRPAFAGTLDDVAVYGTALSAAQVAAHWSAGSGHVAGP
jgi:hypothetical protein